MSTGKAWTASVNRIAAQLLQLQHIMQDLPVVFTLFHDMGDVR